MKNNLPKICACGEAYREEKHACKLKSSKHIYIENPYPMEQGSCWKCGGLKDHDHLFCLADQIAYGFDFQMTQEEQAAVKVALPPDWRSGLNKSEWDLNLPPSSMIPDDHAYAKIIEERKFCEEDSAE